MVLPGASRACPGVADQHLLGADADPPALAVGVRAAGRDRDPDAVHVDGDQVGVAAHDAALDQVGLAEEVGHERRARVLVELRGSAQLLDQPAVHHRDGVGHRHGLLLVVGDVDEGQADLGLDALELDLHPATQLEVERPQRLVEQQHLGLVDQGPGQRDPLLLATGELHRLLAGLVAELDEVEHAADLLVDVLGLASSQPEGDVLVDVEVREQRVALEDRVDRTPVGLGVGDVVAGQGDACPRWVARARPPSASVVVLPQPEGPSSAKNEPRGTSRSRWSTAVKVANSLVTDRSRNPSYAASSPPAVSGPRGRVVSHL